MIKKFFELIQIAIGNKERFEQAPTDREWSELYELACKQSLTGITLDGVNKLSRKDGSNKPPLNILYAWIGLQQKIVVQNELQNRRVKELCELFKAEGFLGCVLKGQGTALYYEKPELRQCGDIDLWVTREDKCKTDEVRNSVLHFAKDKGYHIGHIDIKHSDINFFKDVPVEVHFIPSWMYNPFINKRLQRYFCEQKSKQFGNIDSIAGFTHTAIEFDLVYSMVHIYRHIFSEGIGLRQLMDYYYILIRSDKEQRDKAFDVLKSIKMKSFVGGIMWILKDCFDMQDIYLLCSVNKRHGGFLLSEILMAGNFGQSDERTKRVSKDKKFKRGFVQLGRNLRFVSYYPSEVLWSPFWKLWHYFWRKSKGYL